MCGQALWTSMTDRVHLGTVAGLSHEWIVRRHSPVVTQAQHLPSVIIALLCAILLLALADRQLEEPASVKRDASAEVRRRGAPAVGNEDIPDTVESTAGKFP